jgi:hypothetical protein
MSVRPVASAPKSASVSQVRRKPVESTSEGAASFAELSSAPVQDARAGSDAQREPTSGAPGADGDAIANIAAAYLIFGGNPPR